LWLQHQEELKTFSQFMSITRWGRLGALSRVLCSKHPYSLDLDLELLKLRHMIIMDTVTRTS
jgi:hypothetical protein